MTHNEAITAIKNARAKRAGCRFSSDFMSYRKMRRLVDIIFRDNHQDRYVFNVSTYGEFSMNTKWTQAEIIAMNSPFAGAI